jgi:putative heme-binding domain-containing protein
MAASPDHAALHAQQAPADPFAAHVRPTPAKTPQEEQASFRVPEGFEVTLFASEPDLQKPMNMAFDARGRLWVTGSVEYPYAAAKGQPGRDTVKILEDADGDGRAEKITTFADGLNIPIGLYPYKNGVVVFSIPNIYYLEDTDGDDRADRREVLYGPLGVERDTHGLNNAFRRGLDGWLYICHGFNNETTIRGRDGSQVTMQSGNTYRVRLDGSRVEAFTRGQVNPFGMTMDPEGNFYTADCHSKPISLLIRGGYYPSFGKPHDGLGFVPPVMDHGHGSTAISGIAYCSPGPFPARYHGTLFVGNVMTSRVHNDSLPRHGATMQAQEEPDFIATDDPWFRPVDLRFGPDGALYVADFYNRIIGHYEVPLNHPGRDRRRGRIWRVAYRGTDPAPVKEGRAEPSPRQANDAVDPQQPRDLAQATTAQLIEALGHENLTVRMLATDQLSDRIGTSAVEPLRQAAADSPEVFVRVHALWALHRLNGLDAALLDAAATAESPLLRLHAMKVLSETPEWTMVQRQAVLTALDDAPPAVARAAADALGQQAVRVESALSASAAEPASNNAPEAKEVPVSQIAPEMEDETQVAIHHLLDRLHRVPAEDVYLRHTIRIALRNELRVPGALARLKPDELDRADAEALAETVLAVHAPAAADYLIHYIRDGEVDPQRVTDYLSHAARYSPPEAIDALAQLVRAHVGEDLDLQLGMFQSIQAGQAQRGIEDSPGLKRWAAELAAALLDSIDLGTMQWSPLPVPDDPAGRNPWTLSHRPSSDGDRQAKFLSSFPLGEPLRGTLRSTEFEIPPRLQFYLAGHLGSPDKPPVKRNLVRLRLAETGETIATAYPPRNDTAHPVTWDLTAHAGSRGYLELVDGISAGGYAWMAVGRFDPPVVQVPQMSPAVANGRQRAAAQMVQSLEISTLLPAMRRLVAAPEADPQLRAAAARALADTSDEPAFSALTAVLGDASLAPEFRDRTCQAIARLDAPRAAALLEEAMRSVPRRLQVALATQLAANAAGSTRLLDMVTAGKASPRLLQQADLRQRIVASGGDASAARIEQLIAALPPVQEELLKLLQERIQQFDPAAAEHARGEALFTKHCAACHQIGGKGAIIGPQLDGIGNRGLERVAEDVLDPNRNVDRAFRSQTFALDDGRIVLGLLRRDLGDAIVVADNTGKEITIPKQQIDLQAESTNSLMPENLATTLSDDEFRDLLGYLLEQRQKVEKRDQPDAAANPPSE